MLNVKLRNKSRAAAQLAPVVDGEMHSSLYFKYETTRFVFVQLNFDCTFMWHQIFERYAVGIKRSRSLAHTHPSFRTLIIPYCFYRQRTVRAVLPFIRVPANTQHSPVV